jgi:hypothetical protein
MDAEMITQIVQFSLYIAIAIMLASAGIGVFSNPILFFSIMGCVFLIDILGFYQGMFGNKTI